MPTPTDTQIEIPNVLKLLKEDHDRVKRLFATYEQLNDEEDENDTRREIVELACLELTIHAQLEEELFYPALHDALGDARLLDEAQVEHNLAKQLITELEKMAPGEAMYDAKFTVLGEYMAHHIDEEETKLFPEARKAKLDLENLAIDLIKRKAELQEAFGVQPDDFDEDARDIMQPPSQKDPARRPRA